MGVDAGDVARHIGDQIGAGLGDQKTGQPAPAQAVVDDHRIQFQDGPDLVPRRPIELEASDRAEGVATPEADQHAVAIVRLLDTAVERRLDRSDLGRARVALGELPERLGRDFAQSLARPAP